MNQKTLIVLATLLFAAPCVSATDSNTKSFYCDLIFTVTEKGKTKDIKVVECNTPYARKKFGKQAKRLARKYKYKPRIVNGQPVDRLNVELRQIFLER